MTITPFDIYIISLVDKLSIFFMIMSVIFLFVVMFSFPALGCCFDDKPKPTIKRWQYTAIVLFFVCMSVNTLIPSSKTLAAMYVLPAIVNNKHIQNSTGNALEALENLTKEWLKDSIKNSDKTKKEKEI